MYNQLKYGIRGVYCLTFPNGKRYVGISFGKKGIKKRWEFYRGDTWKKQDHNRKLYNALNKYGSENIKYEVILITEDIERMKRVEKQLIALWGLQNDKFGYNISDGGDGNTSRQLTPEQRKRKSDAAKLSIATHGHPRLGKHLSKEQKDKQSKSMTGRKYSDEVNKKKGRPGASNPFYGKKHSKESIEKIRLARLNRVITKPSRE